MYKKILFFLLFLLAISCQNDKIKSTPKDFTLINAVPISSTIIIETQSLSKLKDKLYTSEVWKVTKSLNENKSIKRFFDEVITIIPEKECNENFVITSTLSGGRSFDYLLLKYVDSTNKEGYISRLKEKYAVTSTVYDNANLYVLNKGAETLYLAIHNNILLLSEEKLLVEEGIRQLNSDSSILSNQDFKKIYEATDSNKDANVFIQYADLNQFAKNYFKNADTQWLKFLADWSAIEVDFSSENIELEGVTTADFIKATYFSIFKDVKPQNKEILKELPNSTAALVYIALDDYSKFSSNYDRYLNTSQILFEKQHNLEKYENYKPITEFSKWIGKEVVMSFLSENNEKNFNELFLVQSKNDQVAKEVLENISATSVDYRGFEIRTLQYEAILQDVFGNYAKDLSKPSYILIDNYVVFGNSINTLKSYVNDILLQNYFMKVESNVDFVNSFNSKAHVFAMGNGRNGIQLVKSLLSKKNAKEYVENTQSLAKINYGGFQINFDEHVGFTQCLVNISDSKGENDISVSQNWNQIFPSKIKQVDLVTNYKTNQKELAIQSEDNILYLVSNTGKKYWNKKLEEPILGEIHQMDIFKNGRLQFVFNTKSHLYVLDQNGKEVAPFPLKLSTPATAGIGLFDYDKNRKYRILVPQGSKMTMYNQSGGIVSGFKYTMGKSVNRAPKHIRLKGKDYITTTATDGTVLILTRVGTLKTEIKEKFSIQDDVNLVNNRIAFQTSDNNSVLIGFDGGITSVNNSKNDKFLKISKSGILHLEKDVVVFKGKNTIKYDLDPVNEYKVDFYEDAKEQFLIVMDQTLKQVTLVDKEGDILPGFPIFGENKVKIYQEKGSYYLITESSIDNSILYYTIK